MDDTKTNTLYLDNFRFNVCNVNEEYVDYDHCDYYSSYEVEHFENGAFNNHNEVP